MNKILCLLVVTSLLTISCSNTQINDVGKLNEIIDYMISINNTAKLNHLYVESIDLAADVVKVVNASTTNMDDGTSVVYPCPGGYPSFWPRDYAMGLESSYPFTAESVKECYYVIRNAVPTTGDKAYWVPDHVNKDGKPVWKAGTYNSDPSTDGFGSRASMDGIGFLVKIADKYVRMSNDKDFMASEYSFLLSATKSIMKNNLAYTSDDAVVFGFEDCMQFRGYVAYASVQAYETFIILKEWADIIGVEFTEDIDAIRKAFNEKFVKDNGKKLLRLNGAKYAETAYVAPSTIVDSNRFDVWLTAYAIRSGILSEGNTIRCANALLYYKDSYIRNGMAKHVPDEFYYSDTQMWEGGGRIGRYQYGGYWSTPMADIVNAIKIVSRDEAEKLLKDVVEYAHKTDYPEVIHEDGSAQNLKYVASVAYAYSASLL